jgi:hypothetical protein
MVTYKYPQTTFPGVQEVPRLAAAAVPAIAKKGVIMNLMVLVEVL